jgi:hypothetical protein
VLELRTPIAHAFKFKNHGLGSENVAVQDLQFTVRLASCVGCGDKRSVQANRYASFTNV